ncbi:MAG: type I-G CRISPR-associated protein, Cas3-extension family [Bryobacteraceae bacterium]
MSGGMLLRGLDGSNPLAFLAALGTLRLLHLRKPDAGIRMKWLRSDGFWRPALAGLNADENGLCELLQAAPWAPVEQFEQIGKNLTVPRDRFQSFVQQAHRNAMPHDRRTADFAAAFGCEICEDKEKGRIEYTDLCFITGSGHQDFLGTIAALAKHVTVAHLRDALFGEWRAARGLSMRWDPSDAAEYALRWDDPGPKGAWAVWGANRLAAEALPYFPALPGQGRLQTTGFRWHNRQGEFTWPIWSSPADFDTVRSLMSLQELQENSPPRKTLCARGIEEVYRARRVRIGQGANFKVSFRPARAV